jgi:hypothetical protein
LKTIGAQALWQLSWDSKELRAHCSDPVAMSKPRKRSNIPPRNSDNNKRRLAPEVLPDRIAVLRETVHYEGSPKHKKNPVIFGLEPFRGDRGDATLCDEHASFQPANMAAIPAMIDRGLRAGLIGTNIWAVADDGWIFQGSVTNADQGEYHGYPVRPTEAIAEPVYRRFKAWADAEGNAADKQAAENCAALYRFR